jgi:uncharacterized protein with beta-barrel porin domain
MGQLKWMRDARRGRRDLLQASLPLPLILARNALLTTTLAAGVFAAVLLGGSGAWAACNPTAPVSNTTVTCATTTNQNGTNGYGTGAENNDTINVIAGATVTGTNNGLSIGDNNIVNIAPTATVTGTLSGIIPNSATAGTLTVNNQGTVSATSPTATSSAILSGSNEALNVTNSGTITGIVNAIQTTQSFITLNNQSGGAITATGSNQTAIVAGMSSSFSPTSGVIGSNAGLISAQGFAISSAGTVTLSSNSGTIQATSVAPTLGTAIAANGDVTIDSNAGTISGTTTAVQSGGNATVTNSGMISGAAGSGITATGTATLTNNSGATVVGGGSAVIGSTARVINSGTLSSATGSTIIASTATVTNNASGLISNSGANFTIAGTTLNVTNAGTIQETGGGIGGALFGTGTTNVTNSGMITTNGQVAISATGTTTVANSGTITTSGQAAINTAAATTVTNTAGGIIRATAAGNSVGVLTTASTTVMNAGTISGDLDGVNTATSGTTTVTNSGLISGATRQGVRVNTATVTNNAGGTITGVTGAFFRAGNGASTIFNAGTITGTGGTAIQFSTGSVGNILTLGPGSAISGTVVGIGSDIFQLGGVGTGSFNVSAIGPAAQYQGFSTFNKIGTSIWTLTGTNTAALPWTISGGTLSVDGSIANSNATVNAGGTLAGAGTVGNTTINGGTLAPGSVAGAVGPLTAQGSLSFTTASTYLFQASSVNAARVNVTGTATLGGATVNAVFLPGVSINKQYTIVNATGSVSGNFNPVVVSNIANIQATLSYDAHDAFLNTNLVFAAPPNGGFNGNQQSVVNTLTSFFNATGTIPTAFAALGPAGITQVSGETATGSQQTTFDAMTQFLGLMTDPFIDGRGGVPGGAGATPFAEENDAANAYAADGKRRSKSERDAYGMFTKAPQVQPYVPRWSTWAAGFGGSQTTDGNTTQGSNSATSRIFGVAAGADYRFSPFTLAGFALAGGGTNFSVANGGTGRSDLFQVGAFIKHTIGPAYISAALAYGWQDITTDRTVTVAGVDRLHAEFNANAFSGRVESGYRFVRPWIGGVGLTPYAAGQFTTFDLPAYAESFLSGANTFALAYGSKSVTDSRSELGLRTDKSFAMQDAILTLRGRLAWAHDFNPDRNIAATFQALPGASFVVNGAAQAADSALTTASAEVKWLNGWSASAAFEGEFSNVTRSYAGKGVVRYAW